MRQYVARWLAAIVITVPTMFVVVPLAHRTFGTVNGAHVDDSFWQDSLNMAGFYGAYALLAGTIGSLVHTWLTRRFAGVGNAGQILLATFVGIVVLLPQAVVFGRGYWTINLLTGAVAGLIYGALVTLVPGFDRRPAVETL